MDIANGLWLALGYDGLWTTSLSFMDSRYALQLQRFGLYKSKAQPIAKQWISVGINSGCNECYHTHRSVVIPCEMAWSLVREWLRCSRTGQHSTATSDRRHLRGWYPSPPMLYGGDTLSSLHSFNAEVHSAPTAVLDRLYIYSFVIHWRLLMKIVAVGRSIYMGSAFLAGIDGRVGVV